MAVAPNGDVLVAQTGAGRVVAIDPKLAPSQTPRVVITGLSLPHGLRFRGADLYVATWSGVLKGRYSAQAPLQATVLFSDMPEAGDHNHRALALGQDGSIFVSSGSDCNVCVEMNARLGTVLRYDGNGRNGAVYAMGLRNASGLDFDDHGVLWAVVNQRDNIGPTQAVTDERPPDELVRIERGTDYGFPYCYPLHHAMLPNPEFPDTHRCAAAHPADFEFQAHSAPLDLLFYRGHNFPAHYQGAALVAFHGSWNRSTPTGAKVVAVFFKSGHPVRVEDFATGWLQPDGSYTGRPVGLALARDGSVYVSDDSGLIYRIRYNAGGAL
ncbi:MAG: PQQ-dependent sugar dehydrogenase [Candidatus Eremiobacteraeota bacterium]|nr:PQQ-dependent sugar dehydrogenase [Candidatus Eremiobacteraeota bacterium]